MSWYNPLSWGDKAADNILDKDNGLLTQVGNWIGGQQYTDEEKAESNERLRVGVVGYAIAEMDEYLEFEVRPQNPDKYIKGWFKELSE